MKLHEYQAKELFARYGVPVPNGRVAATPDEARAIAEELGGKVVIKAQIHAGGRGKGRIVSSADAPAMYRQLVADPANHEGQVRGPRVGGVRLADTPEEAEREAANLLGSVLVSIQSGPEGKPVRRVLVEEQSSVAREYYFSIIVDGATASPLILASSEGGQEIEAVARRNPAAIVRLPINPAAGYQPYVGRVLAARLGFADSELAAQLSQLAEGLYRCAIENDASLVEVNPLVVTSDGRLLALDAKFNLDDNAIFRHQDLAALRDREQEDPLEVRAQELGIANYIKLEGNIGCIVNGAGLAMATMDVIKLAGGEPANFLDIGTVNDPQRVVNAIRVILEDPAVKAILINIFGGMARVDIVAQGMIDAFRQMEVHVPIVMRLVGTNLAEGEALVREAGIDVIRAQELGEAAEKAVQAARAAAGK